MDFFSLILRLGFECPVSYNPADFYLKILSNTSHEEESEYRSFFKQPIEILRKSSNYKPPTVTFTEKFDVKNYKM